MLPVCGPLSEQQTLELSQIVLLGTRRVPGPVLGLFSFASHSSLFESTW